MKQSDTITWILLGVQAFLIVLKLDGRIDWDWLAVFALFPVVIALIVLVVLAQIVFHTLGYKGQSK